MGLAPKKVVDHSHFSTLNENRPMTSVLVEVTNPSTEDGGRGGKLMRAFGSAQADPPDQLAKYDVTTGLSAENIV